MTSAVARRRQIWTAPGESPCTHIDSTVAVITEPSIGNHFAAADHRGYALRNRIRVVDEGAGLPARHELAVGPIGAVGKSLCHTTQPKISRRFEHRRSRHAEQRKRGVHNRVIYSAPRGLT